MSGSDLGDLRWGVRAGIACRGVGRRFRPRRVFRVVGGWWGGVSAAGAGEGLQAG